MLTYIGEFMEENGVKTVYQVGNTVRLKENTVLTGIQMKHDRILRMVFLGQMTTREIAEECGISTEQVRAIVKSPYGQRRLKLLQGVKDYNVLEMTLQVQAGVTDAISTVKQCMLGGDKDSVRLKAAAMWLEMADLYNKKNTTVVHKHLSQAQLQEIKDLADAKPMETLNEETYYEPMEHAEEVQVLSL